MYQKRRDTSIQSPEDHTEKRSEELITATRNDTDNTKTNGTTITRKQKWEEKQLDRRFKRLINNISHEKTWMWLRKGNLKIETESFLIAAQNNAITTNHIQTRIGKTQQNSKCRLWVIETKRSITQANAANKHRSNIRLDTTGWARWSTEICAWNWNLTIRTNGICTT